jgi:hypothetical protein
MHPRTPPTLLACACAGVLAALCAPRAAHAECDRLTRAYATRVAAAARPHAPAWAVPLITPTQLARFDSAGLHELTYFLGWGAITLERLGTNGAAPFSASVVVHCRDGRAEYVSDPYAWANAHAQALHVSIGNAEQAAGYAAEVVSLGAGRRPDAANATRRGGVFVVEVSMAPRQGEASAAPQMLHIEVGRDGSVRLLGN